MRKISVSEIEEFTLDFLKMEKHIVTKCSTRGQIKNSLVESGRLRKNIEQFHAKAVQLMEECFKEDPKDRQSLYRIRYTFYIGDLLTNTSSDIMKWFYKDYCHDGSTEDYSAVVHSIGAAVFGFVQQQVIKIKRNQVHEANQLEKPDGTKKQSNSVLSLLTLAGGTFGKIYKCLKRKIKKDRGKHYRAKESKWRADIKFRKMMYEIVMTAKDKKNPNIPKAIKARDRGWLFIPKWIFLPYLRILDRCISTTAHEDGLKLYGKNLLKVSITVSPKYLKMVRSRNWS